MWAKINAFMRSVHCSVHYVIYLYLIFISWYFMFIFIFSPIKLSFQGLEFTESFRQKRSKDPMESLLFVLQKSASQPYISYPESSLRVIALLGR
ncbi:hypothetical protein OIU77_002168 [Salix suchowensis]|uniref:Uncharacterized protein n=1 Tax=Salix suchowensis TaxID=1278906 RepID=A0ABQ9B3V1_9ROSI|nr:hypothetical protein OIU77_002168 [Salix suchowensis]